MKPATQRTQQPGLQLRVTVVKPPEGVAFAMQRGRSELVKATETRADALEFRFSLSVADASCEPPRLVGPFTQGPPAGRFVYINVGTCAGQLDSPWTRRIKVPLYSITSPQVVAALAARGTVLETSILGTGRDGSPACATVKLLAPWAAAKRQDR